MELVLLPHEVKPWSSVEKLAGVGKEVVRVSVDQGEQAALILWRPYDAGFAGDADAAGGVDQRTAEAAHLVDEAERKRLLAGPDLAGCQRLDLVVGGVAAGGDVVD